MKFIRTVIILLVILVGGAIAWAYSGLYDVSVGTGHNALTSWFLETVRSRSIETRAARLNVPGDLGDEERIRAGARLYDRSCSGCHGRPGREPSDSFDPRPPALARHAPDPAEVFWIVRNGIKMSAMPSKRDLDDEKIWHLAAFLQELPELDPDGYAEWTAEPGQDTGSADDEGDSGDDLPAPAADTPGEALDAFHQALASGNDRAALALLHERATIMEGGHLETRSEYASDHLAADMAFLAGMRTTRVSRDTKSGDGQATVMTRTRITGRYDGDDIDRVITEIASLVETPEGWRITHLNWADAPATAGNGESESTG